jgi:para-aminobenzoate synthetase/4-amino-4-deoxychorismate lyase
VTETIFLQSEIHGRWLAFGSAEQIVVAHRVDEVLPALREVEGAVRQRGLWAAGFLSYEAGPAFDSAIVARAPAEVPCLWFGLFQAPQTYAEIPIAAASGIPRYHWAASDAKDHYDQSVQDILELIGDGDVYQVNHTLRLRAALGESPLALFARMIKANRPRYGAYLDTGRFVVCSASPELFFRRAGNTIESKPMKGTAARGLWQADDEARAEELRRSEKNRAENVMIVDMVRNDLGRIARTGSVEVTRLFDIERYPSLWQMTSTVRATTGADFVDIMRALFPAASITGAPKARATQIIATTETSPRGVYTGCVGFLAPNRQAQFNVAIRTAVIDRERGQVVYGCGGGIVWDSASSTEYAECMLKARIVTEPSRSFELLETLLWEPGSGFFLLDGHMQRLASSARYFDISVDIAGIRASLWSAVSANPEHPQRVRLTVDERGVPAISLRDLGVDPAGPVCIGFARSPVDPSDPFLYHKTTHRRVYEDVLAWAPDLDDVVLWNAGGEVTETTIANIVIARDGRLLTPAISCGLLPGVFRQALCDRGQVVEASITRDELQEASCIWLVNSVRKWRKAVLMPAESTSRVRPGRQ